MNHPFFQLRPILIHSSMLCWILTSIPATANSALPQATIDASIAPQPHHPVSSPPLPHILQASGLEFSDVGRPRRRQGGGSRGSCLLPNQPPLTALVPESSTGYTLAQSPSFWFYLPYQLGEGHAIEFVLKDSQDNLVHAQSIAGKDTIPGILNVRLPDSIVLDTSQSYEWYLLVQCDASNSERFVFVNGAIRRLERPELQQRLVAMEPTAQSNLYMTQEIWYDAVDAIAAQLQSAPQNSATQVAWNELLRKLDLATLATEPIVPCCTAK